MNKSVIITGASAGIGKALAYQFASQGANLGLAARRIHVLETLKADILRQYPGRTIEIAQLDVNKTDTVTPCMDHLFTMLGDVDTVIVNAGINDFTRTGVGDLETAKAIIETNVTGAIATVDAAVAHFRRRGRGQIVGISSLASLRALPTQSAYCASKAALSMYLDCVRSELQNTHIKVTTILPGFIATEIMDNMEQYPFLVTPEQAAREIAAIVAKGKKHGVVPGFPWKFLSPLIARVPDSLLAKMV